MIRVYRFILGISLLVVVSIACDAPERGESVDSPVHQWQQVYKDSDYQVSLDTANIELIPDDAYLLWFETRHATTRVHDGEPWNRELIRSFLQCEPFLSFKTVRMSVFHDDGPLVAQQDGTKDVFDQPWEPVRSPSVDEGAAEGACAILGDRSLDGK